MNNSLVLECKDGGNFKPHVEGVHPAVCVDVIDLGLVWVDFKGERKLVRKLKLIFETEQKTEDGKSCTISKNFTASLHPKARLAEFVGKWRGRPVMPGESVDLAKLVGACCTLVISHQQNMVGKTYASIDAVSKPTKKVAPSGTYDPAAARQRIAEWQAKQGASPQPSPGASRHPLPSDGRGALAPAAVPPKSAAPTTAQPADDVPFDPEVGF